MALCGGEPRAEKGRHERFGQCRAYHARPEHEDVDVVVQDALRRRIGIVAQPGANAGHLVGGHARADATAADDEAALGAPAQDGVADRFGVVGIVNWSRGVSPKVFGLMALRAQPRDQVLLQFVARVIGAYRHSHCRRSLPSPRQAAAPARITHVPRPTDRDGRSTLTHMTPLEVANEVADAFAALVRETLAQQPRFACAVPGGSVATIVFPALAARALPWTAVDVFLADERFVEPASPDANQRAVRDHLLAPMSVARPVFHPMPTTGDPDVAARRASEDLCNRTGTPPRLDLVVLGVGPDGHVASLFPEDDDWRERNDWVIAVHAAPKPPPTRLSLGLATIVAARHVWFVAFGAEKAAAIDQARHDETSSLPAAVVARRSSRVRWFLDSAAQGAISPGQG
jgi:6-phosphogluconolactonase